MAVVEWSDEDPEGLCARRPRADGQGDSRSTNARGRLLRQRRSRDGGREHPGDAYETMRATRRRVLRFPQPADQAGSFLTRRHVTWKTCNRCRRSRRERRRCASQGSTPARVACFSPCHRDRDPVPFLPDPVPFLPDPALSLEAAERSDTPPDHARGAGRLLHRLGTFAVSRWLSADPRWLGVFRILLGTLLAVDRLRRSLAGRQPMDAAELNGPGGAGSESAAAWRCHEISAASSHDSRCSE